MSQAREQRRRNQRHIEKVSRQFGDRLEQIDAKDWPRKIEGLTRVFRNKGVLVQEFAPAAGTEDMVHCRLSVNLIDLAGDRWADGIGWDQLQAIKNEMGYGAFDAVEVYPRATDVVNVAAMRHLWVLKGYLPFAWRRGA